MDIGTPSVTAPLRLMLQVISAHRRPCLEIYWDFINMFGPPQVFHHPVGIEGDKTMPLEHRFQEIVFHFYTINVGGARAENVTFRLDGDFQYSLSKLSERPLLSGDMVLKQIPPAQKIHLFASDHHYVEKGGSFAIDVRYDGPLEGLNRFLRWWSRFRRRSHQYETRFEIDLDMFQGSSLPPPQYFG